MYNIHIYSLEDIRMNLCVITFCTLRVRTFIHKYVNLKMQSRLYIQHQSHLNLLHYGVSFKLKPDTKRAYSYSPRCIVYTYLYFCTLEIFIIC